MPTYLVKLTPVEKFFFGQKNTFETDNVNYFVRSARLPQQTTILGLLRYQYLLHAGDQVFKGNKIVSWRKAKRLVGLRSFSTTASAEHNNFGQIQGLSPVFLIEQGETGEVAYFPAGLRYQRRAEELRRLELMREQGEGQERLHLLQESEQPSEVYSTKNGLSSVWVSSEGKLVAEEEFFEEDCRVGITKDYEGGVREDAFFYQVFYRFRGKYSFACYFEASEACKLPERKLVHFGGERQSFVMECIPVDKLPADEQSYTQRIRQAFYPSEETYHAVLLLSDAHIKAKALEGAAFSLTEIREFARVITSVRKTKHYYNRSSTRSKDKVDTQGNMCVSEEMELYARGSIFYFDSLDQAEVFQKQVHASTFHKIGYNYTQLIINTQATNTATI